MISIHALRMERDIWTGRRNCRKQLFQSTRSAWSATADEQKRQGERLISIHALRMERDDIASWCKRGQPIFQSTRSAWSATW